MKKRLISLMLSAAMLVGVMAGCGGKTPASSTTESSKQTESSVASEPSDVSSESSAEEEVDASEVEAEVTTFGDESGTPLELWTFVDLHATYYGEMVKKWNEENPDKTINLTATTYPYADMHNKAKMSLQAGTGAPDLIDVEVGQFPNIVAGVDTWLVPLDEYIAPYKGDVVQSRLDLYSGEDGKYYGIDFHVGATVMYYNIAVLEENGITQADIDAVKTWDDWAALGKRYVEAVGQDGKYWTSVDTAGTDWMSLAMAQYGEDWTGGFDDPANVQLDSVKNMLNQQVAWLDDGIAQVSPDGHVDLEAGYQNLLDHNIVAFPKAMWFMSRFLDYMPEEAGNWYIAPAPVFEDGQDRSVGIGGTGTVVTTHSKSPELAGEFIAWAKLSPVGETEIWNQLGFDVLNTSLWSDEAFAHDDTNKFNKYFRNYPYDVLNEIADEIGKISVVQISPTIGEVMNTTVLNEIFEDGVAVEDALQSAQDAIDLEQ